MSTARSIAGRHLADTLNSFDVNLWRIASLGSTPGEFSTNVESFAESRACPPPASVDLGYADWLKRELELWGVFVDAEIVDIDGDIADVRRRSRVLVVDFEELNESLVQQATERNVARVAGGKTTNTERSKVKRENDRRVALGLPKMSHGERDSFIATLRATDCNVAQRNSNAIQTVHTDSTEQTGEEPRATPAPPSPPLHQHGPRIIAPPDFRTETLGALDGIIADAEKADTFVEALHGKSRRIHKEAQCALPAKNWIDAVAKAVQLVRAEKVPAGSPDDLMGLVYRLAPDVMLDGELDTGKPAELTEESVAALVAAHKLAMYGPDDESEGAA